MVKVVGVRFRQAGKIYYFDPVDFELEVSNHVIVETARGVEMGTVLITPKEVEDEQVVSPLKPVIRIATEEDEAVVEKNREKEKEAFYQQIMDTDFDLLKKLGQKEEEKKERILVLLLLQKVQYHKVEQ